MDQVHKFNNMRGMPATDTMFMDPRWRQLSELIYPDHASAWDLVFNRGKFKSVYFTFDEDDDCARWERVELYEPNNLFKIGARKGGSNITHRPMPLVIVANGTWIIRGKETCM